jgi:hypothetical protein
LASKKSPNRWASYNKVGYVKSDGAIYILIDKSSPTNLIAARFIADLIDDKIGR